MALPTSTAGPVSLHAGPAGNTPARRGLGDGGAVLRGADAAVVGVVVGCTPLLLALGGVVLARRRPAARLVLAALLVVGGAALVQGAGHATLAGLAWATG